MPLAPQTRVRRGGQVLEIPAEELVPGDLVLLEAGDRVPADGCVLAAHNAEVAEAALTGESHVVSKHAEALVSGEHPLTERFNMAYSTFNRQFFSNAKLWAALGMVVGLQALVVHWSPAQAIFQTTALAAQDWGLAFAVSSSILLLDEGYKLTSRLLQSCHSRLANLAGGHAPS